MSDSNKSTASTTTVSVTVNEEAEGTGATASASTSSSSDQQTPASGQGNSAAQKKANTADDNGSSQKEGKSGGSDVDRVQQCLNRLSIKVSPRNRTGSHEDGTVPKLLDQLSLEGVARYLQSGKCHKVLTLVGAGNSTSAGIPDFRSPGTGLYDNLQQYNLPFPQAIFMIDFFRKNPKPFFVLAKELFPGSLKPTLCHYFIRMLHTKGLLLRHYTQNIDTLERVSGLPEAKVVEAHGTFHTAHCLQCNAEYTLPWMKEKIFADEIPTCSKEDCVGVVKPDIVFFGEQLPDRFASCAWKDLGECDMVIVMGTSMQVQPFASLVTRVPRSVPRLYINLEKTSTGEDDVVTQLMGGVGFDFDAENNYRDVFHQDTCDDGCSKLADLLGWGDELRALVKEEHARIDKEVESKGENAQKEKGESAL